MSESSPWHRYDRTTSINSFWKRKILTIFSKTPIGKQNEDAIFLLDFGELTIDSLIDIVTLTSATSEAGLLKIWFLAPQKILNETPPPDFQIMVMNGHLKTPSATAEFQYEAEDILFKERFIVMTNLKIPLFGLLFVERNSSILDMRQRVLNFFFFSLQLKHADNTYSNINEPL